MPIHSTFIRYFDEVRRSGSIREAATKLYCAISGQPTKLQVKRGTGHPLFEHVPSGIKMTLAGEAFAAHATDTLNKTEQLIEEIHALTAQTLEQATNPLRKISLCACVKTLPNQMLLPSY